MAPASAAVSPRRRLQQQQQQSQPPPPPSIGPAEDAPLEVISLNSPSTASEGSSTSGGSSGKAARGGSGRRAMIPPFQLEGSKGSGPSKGGKGAQGRAAKGSGAAKGKDMSAKGRALVRTKKLVRALGFFYHLSLAVLFTTFTELLLGDFGGNFSKTAAFLGTCAGVERGVQFFTSPFLGNLSDSVGRRVVLLASLSLHLASLVLVTIVPNRNSVLCYFIVNGACNVTLGMTNAMVADLCTAQGKTGEGEMAQQYGKLGMAIGLSMIIGPAVGPSLQKLDVHYPLYLSILFLGVSLLLGLVLSETLAPQHRAPFSWAKSNPFHALRAALRYRRFLLFSAPFCLSQLAECVYQFVVLYTQKRFGWGYVMLGFYVSATGIFLALVQGNLRFIVPRFVSQNGCVTVGLLGHALGMSMMGVASRGWMMALAVAPQMVASLKGPGLMSVLAQDVSPEQQGVLQGSVMSLRVISKAIGGPIFGAVLAFAMSEKAHSDLGAWVIGLPFLVAGACDFVGSILAWLVFKFTPELQPGASDAAGAADGPGVVLVSSSRKSKADAAMEEGGAPLPLPRNESAATFDETATASSLDHDQEGSSLGGEGEDAGEAFEKRSHMLFPGQHAEFDGLDPLSI